MATAKAKRTRAAKPKPKPKTAREQFHPGRREQATLYIEALSDPRSRTYATAMLDHIWWPHKKAPTKPRGIPATRVKEIDAALLAIFSTVR